MRTLVVFNKKSGSSGRTSRDALLKILGDLGEVQAIVPEKEDLAAQVDARAGEADLIVAAGGDGTVNRTVNAIADRLDRIELGVIPLGTGNDFARTLGLPEDPDEAARAIADGQTREVDLGLASGPGVERLFVNACIGGFPVKVDEAVSGGAKRVLGPLAYIAAGGKAAVNLTRSAVTMDGVHVEDCVAAGVGNGRTCGGGIAVWPHAKPDDGLLDGCAMGVSGPAAAVQLAARVRRGAHLAMDGVEAVRAGEVRIDSDPPMEFNVDGELLNLTTPARFRIAGRLRVRSPQV
jgi:diacylglycerol kinase (ATP)